MTTSTLSRTGAVVALLALVLAVALPAATPARAATTTSNPAFTANVMAPLWVDASLWATFESQIRTAKEYDADAVSVDIWWGKVETADQVFDWSYSDTLFRKVTARGLRLARPGRRAALPVVQGPRQRHGLPDSRCAAGLLAAARRLVPGGDRRELADPARLASLDLGS